ncbi:uncharacterized protein BYT42DRAFT_605754 [Radiomyces spectabilis]|uniref:uncharacterized protein n=1 Tax=Radiomyces spectabilis TaxID=64574 RepID=UPI0022211072|nr:uncharacterized protein BYT42DRAFT_605754 [Radiomyces spectabilis]KAI8376097.1 hypothetical protein BYT42DRAFT_605754 [Radiomyces spectabilis]
MGDYHADPSFRVALFVCLFVTLLTDNMPRISPAVTYAVAVVLILWLILGAITLPNATRWFQGDGPSVQQDVVVLPINGTSITKDAQFVYGEWHYHRGVSSTLNTPDAPKDGLQGILYDRGLSCSAHVIEALNPPLPDSMAANISKIALVRRGGCDFTRKLRFAQMDGANAVIVYDNVTSEDSVKTYDIEVQPNSVSIPAYFVHLSVGSELLERLGNISKMGEAGSDYGPVQKVNDGFHTNLLARVTLWPPRKPLLDPWQFALIIIGIILVTSLAIVVVMQCHLWRLSRQNSRDSDEETHSLDDRFWRDLMGDSRSLMARPRRSRLEPSALEKIPTRIYPGKPPVWHTDPPASEDDGPDPTNMHKDGTIQNADSAEPSKQEQTTCVVCLEPFKQNEVLRCLPCGHEYHCECIDTWLIKKSASCPLCLQIIEAQTARPEAVHINDGEVQRRHEQTDVAEVWHRLSSHPSATRRQHPNATVLRSFWMQGQQQD